MKRRRGIGGGIAAVIGACAVCCAWPVLAGLGGLGVASAVGALWIPALLVVTVVVGVAVVMVRRRRTVTPCENTRSRGEVADLDIPPVRPARP